MNPHHRAGQVPRSAPGAVPQPVPSMAPGDLSGAVTPQTFGPSVRSPRTIAIESARKLITENRLDEADRALQSILQRSKKDAEAILTPLLRNVYRAFDHRSESEIYDVLARSVDGELLRKLYLETIQALTLEGREGTRVTSS